MIRSSKISNLTKMIKTIKDRIKVRMMEINKMTNRVMETNLKMNETDYDFDYEYS